MIPKPVEPPPPAPPPPRVVRPDSARGYTVISLSVYDADMRLLDDMVYELKRRGWRRAGVSQILRIALRRLDIDSIDFTREPK